MKPRARKKVQESPPQRRTSPHSDSFEILLANLQTWWTCKIECYQLRMKHQYLEDDNLFIFPVLAAEETWSPRRQENWVRRQRQEMELPVVSQYVRSRPCSPVSSQTPIASADRQWRPAPCHEQSRSRTHRTKEQRPEQNELQNPCHLSLRRPA